MSDPPLSDIYFKNKMGWVWTTLKIDHVFLNALLFPVGIFEIPHFYHLQDQGEWDISKNLRIRKWCISKKSTLSVWNKKGTENEIFRFFGHLKKIHMPSCEKYIFLGHFILREGNCFILKGLWRRPSSQGQIRFFYEDLRKLDFRGIFLFTC